MMVFICLLHFNAHQIHTRKLKITQSRKYTQLPNLMICFAHRHRHRGHQTHLLMMISYAKIRIRIARWILFLSEKLLRWILYHKFASIVISIYFVCENVIALMAFLSYSVSYNCTRQIYYMANISLFCLRRRKMPSSNILDRLSYKKLWLQEYAIRPCPNPIGTTHFSRYNFTCEMQ